MAPVTFSDVIESYIAQVFDAHKINYVKYLPFRILIPWDINSINVYWNDNKYILDKKNTKQINNSPLKSGSISIFARSFISPILGVILTD